MTMPRVVGPGVVGPVRGLSLNPYSLTKYVDALPIPGIVTPAQSVPDPTNKKARIPRYRIAMREFQAKVHRDMGPTTFGVMKAHFRARRLKRAPASP